MKCSRCGGPRVDPIGRSLRCRPCRIEVCREWRKANPDKQRACELAWEAANPAIVREAKRRYRQSSKKRNPELWRARKAKERARYRALERGAVGSFSPQELIELRKRQRNKCAGCRAPLKTFHVDHIVALARGGTNFITNIQLLCAACNMLKGAKCPIEFMQELGMLL